MTKNPTTSVTAGRRYDLDWLRVIAFGLLIFYHIGMYYVTWNWHVKSTYASDLWERPMTLLNPWRLSLLFVISGVAVKYAADKMTAGAFAWSRFKRLFVPLLFGMFVVVAPQSYFQLRAAGDIEPGFWHFYPAYVSFKQQWELFTPTYNHLWYVLYVLIYTLAIVPLLAPARKVGSFAPARRMLRSPLMLVIPVLPFILYRFTTDIWSPETHDIAKDVGAHVRYGSYFLIGIMIAKSDAFWDGIRRHWRLSAALALVSAVVLTTLWDNWDSLVVDGKAMTIARVLRIAYIWWVICALFGAGMTYLNRPGKALGYLTEAVFPYYILHQTLIIMTGAWLSPFRLGGGIEFLGVLTLTVAGCALLHEFVIRRVSFLRPLFGLKPASRPSAPKAAALEMARDTV